MIACCIPDIPENVKIQVPFFSLKVVFLWPNLIGCPQVILKFDFYSLFDFLFQLQREKMMAREALFESDHSRHGQDKDWLSRFYRSQHFINCRFVVLAHYWANLMNMKCNVNECWHWLVYKYNIIMSKLKKYVFDILLGTTQPTSMCSPSLTHTQTGQFPEDNLLFMDSDTRQISFQKVISFQDTHSEKSVSRR